MSLTQRNIIPFRRFLRTVDVCKEKITQTIGAKLKEIFTRFYANTYKH